MIEGQRGVLPSSASARSPRKALQSGSPTGASAPSPSSAPRRTMTDNRGSRPSARADLGVLVQATRASERSAPRRVWARWHGRSSPPLEFPGHKEQSQRLLPALGAHHGLGGLGRDGGVEHAVHDARGSTWPAMRSGIGVGNVQALTHPVDPAGGIVSVALAARADATRARPELPGRR